MLSHEFLEILICFFFFFAFLYNTWRLMYISFFFFFFLSLQHLAAYVHKWRIWMYKFIQPWVFGRLYNQKESGARDLRLFAKELLECELFNLKRDIKKE